MKESLESARNIHQILIVVCTIIGIFAFSTNPKVNPFERPLIEATLLNESSNYKGKKIDFIYMVLELHRNRTDFVGLYEQSSQFGKINYLPGLRQKKVWPLVKDLNTEDAVKFLNEEFRNHFKKPFGDVDFSGIRVTGEYIFIIGPFIILALLLYLLTLVNHILFISDKSDSKQVLSTFPWLTLFPDTLSRILTGITTFIFPVIASISIIYSSILEQSALVILIIIYTVVIGLPALSLLKDVNSLRKIIYG